MHMKVKGIVDTDVVNYKKICMTIEMPYCSFKCDKENGCQICQNSALASYPNIDITFDAIIEDYMDNPVTHAICFQGLEPFDSYTELLEFVRLFRQISHDDIVIYTGYKLQEIENEILELRKYPNIIVKFGRYIPSLEPRFDEVLGVTLSSNNQFAYKIS